MHLDSKNVFLIILVLFALGLSSASLDMGFEQFEGQLNLENSSLMIDENSSFEAVYWNLEEKKTFDFLRTNVTKSEFDRLQVTLIQSWKNGSEGRIFGSEIENGVNTYNLSNKSFDTVQITFEKNSSLGPRIHDFRFMDKLPDGGNKNDKGILVMIMEFIYSFIPDL